MIVGCTEPAHCDMPDSISLDIDISQERRRFQAKAHRWWARRGQSTAMASVLLTHAPEMSIGESELSVIESSPSSYNDRDLSEISLLDLCCGSCEIATSAARLGAKVTAIDLHPIPVLIGNAELRMPPLLGSASESLRGSSADKTWAGLTNEIRYWSEVLLAKAESNASIHWLKGEKPIRCFKAYKCKACKVIGPIQSRQDGGNGKFLWQGRENTLLCLSCGEKMDGLAAYPHSYNISLMDKGGGGLSDADELARAIISNHVLSPEDITKSHWCSWGHGWLSYVEAISPRQSIMLASFKSAYRSIRNELADQGYNPQCAKALLIYLALGLSDKMDFLSTSCTSDERREGHCRGLSTLYWRRSGDYYEITGDRYADILRRRFREIISIVECNKSLASSIEVISGDMTTALSPDGSKYDLVIWDPPYYDHVSYDEVALPWTRHLRELVGDIDSTLIWPNEATAFQAEESDRKHEAYAATLEMTINNIATFIRKEGRLGIFWLIDERDKGEKLMHMLELANRSNLELLQTFDLSSELRIIGGNKGSSAILLVMRPSLVAAHSANAFVVQEGTIAGRKMMHAGIVEILSECLPVDEIEDIIPSGFKGSLSQKLSETVLSSTDPRELLLHVPKGRLRESAQKLGLEIANMSTLNKEQLASAVMESLGWSMPKRSAFTVGAAIDEITKLRGELRLSKDEEEIRGIGGSIFGRIEQILRFAVVTWSYVLRSDEWLSIPYLIASKHKKQKLGFGDWYRCLIEIPPKYSGESELIERARRLMKKTKLVQTLEPVVKLRNWFCHHDSTTPDWLELQKDLYQNLGELLESLRLCTELRALPIVLHPIKETRDQFGRITLRLAGHRDEPIEFLMTSHSQMDSPVVVIPSDANPREVDPFHLLAGDVFSMAAI
jgi:hypothetical protein